MRKNEIFLGTALLLAGLFSCGGVARADTILNLTVSADVTAMPDELEADLNAQADAPTAAEAQAEVNAMVAKALAAAKPLAGVTASTTQYSVWHQTDPKDLWHASQGIALRSHDGPGLLALIGQLQASGLAVGNLAWQLSPPLAEKTYEQAMAKAVDKLTARGQAAAALLHMKMHGFRSVTLGDGSAPGPRPMMRMMATAAAAPEAPPPNAQADELAVSATVSGEARLEAANE